ncbi:hypothetical protein CYLTODRAFT_369499 [Cylindrobasidium torrendii FP15055 ss-10]|uniref:Protein BCP1 n=1 Tax=Cylindrobasidium torrendii FP15055 ss-10 TaxID=1314674 RepID=A0A0D7BP56_9AGAR|nr:hypothetical protein CYLTODRAFT_369499 [Cylindrobasidium torrendii FP15055 ss-10]
MSKRTKPADSDDESDVSLIDVDFDCFDINPDVDFLTLKRLIKQLFGPDVERISSHDLVELVINQRGLGSTIKTDGQESDPYAVLTILNMHVHKANPAIKSIAEYCLDKSKVDPAFHNTLSALFSQEDKHVGFVLSERLINMPVQVIPPMYRVLGEEVQNLVSNGQPFSFSHLLFISRAYHLTESEDAQLSSSQKKPRKNKKSKAAAVQNEDDAPRPADGVYPFHVEDELITAASVHALDYKYSLTPTEPRDNESFGLDTRGRMMLVPVENFPELVMAMLTKFAV